MDGRLDPNYQPRLLSLILFFFPFIRRRSLAFSSSVSLFSFLPPRFFSFFPDPRLHCCLSSPPSSATLSSPIPSVALSHFHLLFLYLLFISAFYLVSAVALTASTAANSHCISYIALVTTQALQDSRISQMRNYGNVAFFS